MAIITLTTDFGLKDHYASAVKGAILKQLPNVTIIDISHKIGKYNLPETAFILKNAYPNFPKGSIHIIGVRSEQSSQSPQVIVFSDGHYFIGADNGIFSLLLDSPIDKIIALPPNDSVFPTLDIFVDAACHIAQGKPFENLGTPTQSLFELLPFRATSMDDLIRGTVIYIDTYGNVIINITKTLFTKIANGRSFTIELKSHEIKTISKFYNDVPNGEVLALFNSTGYLEIAVNLGKADSLLHFKINDNIPIHFNDN